MRLTQVPYTCYDDSDGKLDRMSFGKRCILSSPSQTLQAFKEICSNGTGWNGVSCSDDGVLCCVMDNKVLSRP